MQDCTNNVITFDAILYHKSCIQNSTLHLLLNHKFNAHEK